jgi:hypothetical protein
MISKTCVEMMLNELRMKFKKVKEANAVVDEYLRGRNTSPSGNILKKVLVSIGSQAALPQIHPAEWGPSVTQILGWEARLAAL